MIRVVPIKVGEIAPNLMSQFKAHARVTDSATDALLETYLREALLKVQEMNDVSLIPCTMMVEDTEVADGEVRLYQTIDEVLSVTTNGHEVSWTLEGNTIKVGATNAKVTYTTKVDEGALQSYLPQVLSYATARYDGVSGLELFKIIAR